MESDVPQLKADLHVYLKVLGRNMPTCQNNRFSGRDLNTQPLSATHAKEIFDD